MDKDGDRDEIYANCTKITPFNKFVVYILHISTPRDKMITSVFWRYCAVLFRSGTGEEDRPRRRWIY